MAGYDSVGVLGILACGVGGREGWAGGFTVADGGGIEEGEDAGWGEDVVGGKEHTAVLADEAGVEARIGDGQRASERVVAHDLDDEEVAIPEFGNDGAEQLALLLKPRLEFGVGEQDEDAVGPGLAGGGRRGRRRTAGWKGGEEEQSEGGCQAGGTQAQLTGFEPVTGGLEIRCSIQLSYSCVGRIVSGGHAGA
jgi:hypothetical protein